MARPDRTERLLDLVSFFLGSREPASWEEIREAFPEDYGAPAPDAAIRKFERDKAELLEIGVPIEWVPASEDRPGGYLLARDQYYLRDPGLDPEELTLLSVAGAAALQAPDFPFRADLAHALDKLFFQRPDSSAQAPHLRVQALSASPHRKDVLEALGRAIAQRKDVTFRYRAFDGETTERRVSPFGLAYRRGAWLLVGHCHLRTALRTFQVERILSLDVNTRAPRRPDFEVPADFDVLAHVGREPWQLGVHAPTEVHFHLDAEVAPLARGRFGPDASLKPVGDGVDVRMQITHGEGLLRELLRLSPHAELLAPERLRSRLASRAAALASRHEGMPTKVQIRASAPVDAPAVGGTPGAGATELQERVRRALFLIPFVVARGGCTVEELCRVLRVDEDRLLEEIDLLRMVGRPPFSPADLIDVDVVDGRVEVFLPQALRRPPALTPLEAAALDAAASALEVEGGEALSRARAKLRAAIPSLARADFDAVAGRVRLAAAGLEASTAALLDCAIRERRELELTYVSASRGEATRRAVRPIERVLHGGYWYLHAHCCERNERRLFRLDRASELILTERRFELAVGEAERRFQESGFFGLEGARKVAELRLSPGPLATQEQARRLGATKVHFAEDGALIARIPVDGAAFVTSVVLSLEEAAELLSPPELRERVAALARRAAARHA